MNLSSISVTPGSKGWSLTNNLFVRAFPAEERTPLYNLNNPHLLGDFRAFFLNNAFCGLAYMIMDSLNCYLFYLAVEDDIRNMGVGSSMLSYIRNLYPNHRIVLEMETLDSSAANYQERLRRNRFYTRNGLFHTSVTIEQCGVPYLILSTDKNYSLADYRNMWIDITRRQGKTGQDATNFLHEYFGNTLKE